MRFKFVHAADLHLDSPLRGVRQHFGVNEQPTLQAFERIVTLCLQEKVNFLLLAGDLYDKKDRSVRARLFLQKQLSRLHQHGIQTFIVHGNHDPLDFDPGALSLPPSVKVFERHWEAVPVKDESGTVYCTVQGISYGTERVTKNLSGHFSRQGPEFQVGLLHANVGENTGHANYAPCTVEDLSKAGLDYWALGHVHTRKTFSLPNGRQAVYPGNPQGRHVNETGPRGCMLVSVDGESVESRFVPTHTLLWSHLHIDFSEESTLDGLLRRVQEEVALEAEKLLDGATGLCLRVTLTGRGPLHGQLTSAETWAEWEETVAASLQEGAKPVFLESMKNATLPELDVEQLLSGGGLWGTLGEVWKEKPSSQLFEELIQEDSALKKLMNELKKAGVNDIADADSLLSMAAEHALELLAEEKSP